jgi:PAS domain S-box-containing protein
MSAGVKGMRQRRNETVKNPENRSGSESGEMRRRLDAFDWAATALGHRDTWPASLKLSVDLILLSGFPMAVRWGPHLIMIYNDAYAPLLGDKHPASFGRPTRETWPEIWDRLGPLSESILRGERKNFFAVDHLWLLQRNGVLEEARFTISYSPVPDPTAPNGIGGLLTTVFETTERVRAEKRLRRLTDQLESEVAQRTRERDRIWQVSDDLLGVTSIDGRFIGVNPAWSRLLGWSEDEIKAVHIDELRHPDDAAVAHAGRAALGRGAPTLRIENRFRHRDGSWRWIAWTMTADEGLVYIAGRHITKEKEALEALRHSEQQLRSLMAGVVDYAIFMLDPHGIVSSWNAGAERIKGYRSDEIIGRHFSTFYTPEDRAEGKPEHALAVAAEAGKFELEGRRVRKDGSVFWANVVLDAIRGEDGALIGFAKVTRDITERRETQAALEHTQQQLAQAQKLEALGQLTGGVAHDFNNLLMIVSGQTQMLLRRIDGAKDVRALRAIQTATARGETLTRQLLTFARRQPLNPKTVDPAESIMAFRDVLASSARGNIDLHIGVPADIWPISVDVSEFELALVNLAVNARDAMPEGGALTVLGANLTLSGDETLEHLTGEFVALSLSDSGTGIAPELIGKVFEPFFTTKGDGKGTGLGLSQAYGFARQSGGAIAIESTVGRGTTVTIYLPRASAPATPAAAEGRQIDADGQGETILVVEDNPEVKTVAVSLLEDLGYRVVALDSARAALDLITQGERVDLVFSDVMLPGEMDGLALARALRATRPDLPVLLTSGYARVLTEAHQFPILRKPYQISALAETVRKTLASAGH